jgi:hypothetical protein
MSISPRRRLNSRYFCKRRSDEPLVACDRFVTSRPPSPTSRTDYATRCFTNPFVVRCRLYGYAKHVHVTGHASGNRMDRVLHLDAALLEQILEFANRVLCLRHRRAEPGTMMTCEAYASSAAVSCADTERSSAPLPPLALPPEDCTEPNAPKSTLVTEGFTALPISNVSSVPEAPTSAPEMINTLLLSTKPVSAGAMPVSD